MSLDLCPLKDSIGLAPRGWYKFNTPAVDLSAESIEFTSDVANRSVPQHNKLVAVTHPMKATVYLNISKLSAYPRPVW